MKRVKSACILQTLAFSQKPELGLSKATALEANRSEYEHYQMNLKRAKTRYQIIDVSEQEDGSLIVHVRKQVNDNTDVTEYFR